MANETKENLNEIMLPVLALRGKVLFPKTLLNFEVGRAISIKAIEASAQTGNEIFITTQKSAFIDAPKESDLYTTGVIAKIKSIIKMPNGEMKVSAEALIRARIVSFLSMKGFFSASVVTAPYTTSKKEVEVEAYFRELKKVFYEYALFDKRITKDVLSTVNELKDADEFVDNALSVCPFRDFECQHILEIDNTLDRLAEFSKLISKELEIAKIEKKIASKVKSSIDQGQKEFYLREQIKAIHSELGDEEDTGDELVKKIKEKHLPSDVEEKVLKEASRLDRINPSSPDYSILLNYIDWVLDLPFNDSTIDTESLNKAKKILDSDHFGLQKVKQRIVEYLAVLHLTKEIKGPILCFVGPPGVGKTSVAMSIARAMNRKFVRMSLGGVKDEAEIRGHRKTYVGAMPGRIIYGLKSAKTNNPVFLLDEIDKMSSDIHGDPASALLEVLDPEQNSTFRDRYLEVPIDLSKVMFITTANSVDTIPSPLLDRMEVIELTGYTDEEKKEIAKRYLIPKQIKNNGLNEEKIEFTDEAISEIIESYTMEAGVRNLEREVGSVIRKIATKFVERPKTAKQIIEKKDIFKCLGIKKYTKDEVMGKDEIGACTGLAWTSVGGVTLTIEVSLMKGKGEIILTGKLGDVMKESARAAISYIRANASKYNLSEEMFEKTDIHIHVPEGATPKDGPSAGITMATAILSAFTKKAVSKAVAMTGEITLRGKVLPIGGLKEKVLAAYRQGIKKIIIPKANEKDLTEIPKEIKKEMKFITVSEIDTVFKNAINW
ncbi:MAG: endopeptidase La [Clostridia bacterium]|nr:endopeptidase La [Clostridia bacterium]